MRCVLLGLINENGRLRRQISTFRGRKESKQISHTKATIPLRCSVEIPSLHHDSFLQATLVVVWEDL